MNAHCKLCGGDRGTFIDGAHALCTARAAHGQPTPCLGMRCATCNGTGRKPGMRGGVMLFLEEGPARIARSIEAQFPPCVDCAGTGERTEASTAAYRAARRKDEVP